MANNSPYIFEANPSNFKTLVLENSEKELVMVYYWSLKLLNPKSLRNPVKWWRATS